MFEVYHKITGERALTGRSANKKHTLPSSRSSIFGRKNESRKQTQTVRKRLLQDPRLQRSFCLQGVRTHCSAVGRGQRAQKSLPELPFEPARRYRARRQSRGLRGNHGPHSGLGEEKRRVGDSPPLPQMRCDVLEPRRRGR